MDFEILLLLEELGVITGVYATVEAIISRISSDESTRFEAVLKSSQKGLLVEAPDPTKELRLPAYVLTQVGKEIMSLGSFEPDVGYLRLVGAAIKKQGFSVKLVEWRPSTPGTSNFYNIEEI